MRRALLAVLLILAAATMLLQPWAGIADEYCVRTGLTIGDEPWLAHEHCADCPFEDCPPVPDLPGGDGEAPVTIEISHHA